MVTNDELSLPLSMSDFDDSPILLANHFLIQHQPDEFVVSLSQVTAPPLVGPPEEIRAQARSGGDVPVPHDRPCCHDPSARGRDDRAPPGASRRARSADGRRLTCGPARC